MSAVGENIKRIRKLMKMSQVELSNRSGISQSAISDIENPSVTKLPNINTVTKIAQVLGCTVSDLTGEKEIETDLTEWQRRLLSAASVLNEAGIDELIRYINNVLSKTSIFTEKKAVSSAV